ncbi:MAG: polysaccharide / oligosaccharide deacetylase [Devosia sp.]|uniref:polysaccharide deacetylase family protein n=1 Tax=Devosia sp. TaxID=1871048 RepID=UPI002609184B|nr:polysaccharide deacetylase family protein [Devosia sp.]MDB5540184.1 polysaccharide / oligosaccharide deacetylase [Devosia sp.]
MDIRIVNFHGIGAPQRDLEVGEAPFWLSRDQFCAVLDRIAGHRYRSRLAITFDDGNVSDLDIALPELQQRGLAASFFVLTGRLDRPGSLSRADVATLETQGMRIGSHGVDHNDLTTIAPEQLLNDLVRSREVLEDVCANPVGSFAIPFGRYNSSVLRAIKIAGYRTAYSSDGGSARAGAFLQPRRSLRRDMSPTEIDRILAGRMPLLRQIRRSVAMRVRQMA